MVSMAQAEPGESREQDERGSHQHLDKLEKTHARVGEESKEGEREIKECLGS